MLCGYCHSTFVNGRAEGGALMASQPILSRLPVMLPLGSCLPVPMDPSLSHHALLGCHPLQKLQHGQNVSMFACFAFLCRTPHGV